MYGRGLWQRRGRAEAGDGRAAALPLSVRSRRDQDASGDRGHADAPGAAVARLQHAATILRAAVTSDLSRDFLDATSALRWVRGVRVWQDPRTREVLSASRAAKLAPQERARLVSRVIDELAYYEGRYGSALLLVGLLDAVAGAGVLTLSGAHVVDIGYASILGPRLMASIGAHVEAVESDSYPHALYELEAGPVRVVKGVTATTGEGSLRLRLGRLGVDWSPDEGWANLIVARNVLKAGYVEQTGGTGVDLGMSAAEFVATLRRSLATGGRVVMYNTFVRGDPSPGGDGRCPFAASVLENAGFVVEALDRPDDEHAGNLHRAMLDASGVSVSSPPPGALVTVLRAREHGSATGVAHAIASQAESDGRAAGGNAGLDGVRRGAGGAR